MICGSEAFCAVVRDSSAIHIDTPAFDGRRFVTACSSGHLLELQEQYRQRPFVDEELWVGKLARAMDGCPDGLNPRTLAEATGLTAQQVEAAITWQNERFRCWRAEREHGPSGQA